MKSLIIASAILSLSVVPGCGSSTNTPASGTGGATTAGTGGATATGTGGATATGTGGVTGAGGSTAGTGGAIVTGTGGATGGPDGSADGPLMYTLTVSNYLDWCDVTENGTLYAASVPPVMSFAPNTVVNLNAVPNYIFVWGYWTGTDGDKTSAHDTGMTTTVTMTSNKTIQACCPDPPPAAPTCP